MNDCQERRPGGASTAGADRPIFATLGFPLGDARALSEHVFATHRPAAVRRRGTITINLGPDALPRAAGPGGHRTRMRDRAMRFIDDHLANPLVVPALAAELGVSRVRLARLFADDGGVARYVRRRRLARARDRLADPDETRPIACVVAECGFASAAHFSRAFRAAFGQTPREARRRGRG